MTCYTFFKTGFYTVFLRVTMSIFVIKDYSDCFKMRIVIVKLVQFK